MKKIKKRNAPIKLIHVRNCCFFFGLFLPPLLSFNPILNMSRENEPLIGSEYSMSKDVEVIILFLINFFFRRPFILSSEHQFYLTVDPSSSLPSPFFQHLSQEENPFESPVASLSRSEKGKHAPILMTWQDVSCTLTESTGIPCRRTTTEKQVLQVGILLQNIANNYNFSSIVLFSFGEYEGNNY